MGKDLTVRLLFETKQRRGTIVISDALGNNKCLASGSRVEFSLDLVTPVSSKQADQGHWDSESTPVIDWLPLPQRP